MLGKLVGFIAIATICQVSFAAEKVIFQCDTVPNGSIKVTADNTIFKVNVNKQGKSIFNFSKDYKKNTSKNFIKFNYSYGSEDVAIGLLMGYFGKEKNSLHSIISDKNITFRDSYDIDNVVIVKCINNENYINRFKQLDKEKKLPGFSYD
ncbi:hypothetical protein ACG9XW_09915 [Acinetobacter guillouiae]|uniref:hypothetical protein n=1 Tax=Acinetobacter guillouiae TaxID=106649 RepID=UPI003AF68387